MIALKMDLPKSCLNCPCLETIMVDGVAGRFCRASSNPIVTIPVSEIEDNQKWMEFAKPEWCPLIEMEDREYGEWEEIQTAYDVELRCKACGAKLKWYGGRGFYPHRFCPGCGKRMKPIVGDPDYRGL